MPPRTVPRALVDLHAALRSVRARWFVFGAQAVIAAGAPRLTHDLDVTVEAPPGGVGAMLAALKRRGFSLRDVGNAATFIEETRVIPIVHRQTQLPVDVVLAGPGIEEAMLSRVTYRKVGRLKLPFIDTNDLVALKVLAGRDKDLGDVEALLRAMPTGLESAVARARIAELGAALDDSTLVGVFDRLVEQAAGALRRSRPRSTPKRTLRRRSGPAPRRGP